MQCTQHFKCKTKATTMNSIQLLPDVKMKCYYDNAHEWTIFIFEIVIKLLHYYELTFVWCIGTHNLSIYFDSISIKDMSIGHLVKNYIFWNVGYNFVLAKKWLWFQLKRVFSFVFIGWKIPRKWLKQFWVTDVKSSTFSTI